MITTLMHSSHHATSLQHGRIWAHDGALQLSALLYEKGQNCWFVHTAGTSTVTCMQGMSKKRRYSADSCNCSCVLIPQLTCSCWQCLIGHNVSKGSALLLQALISVVFFSKLHAYKLEEPTLSTCEGQCLQKNAQHGAA